MGVYRNVYRIEIRTVMTAYIEAESEEAALAKCAEEFGTDKAPAELFLPVSGGDYIQLGEGVELSPAASAYGREDADQPPELWETD